MYHPTFEQRQRMDELNRRADVTRRREREEAQAIDAEWERVTRTHTPEAVASADCVAQALAAIANPNPIDALRDEQIDALWKSL